MPRRRSTKARNTGNKPRAINRGEGKINKWNKASDIPLDEEDQFHISRDKILLDSDSFDQDDDIDDEVFTLRGMDDEGSEEEEWDEDNDDEEGEDEETLEVTSSSKNERKKSKKKKKVTDSSSSSSEEEEEEEEEAWGRTKSAYYSSNAAQLESDDEEGNELEEQEAKRLQGKMREGMGNIDFGLNDMLDINEKEETDEIVEPVLATTIPASQDKQQLVRHLEKNNPETLALARDWQDSVEELEQSTKYLQQLQSQEVDAMSLGMFHLHYQALLTYTTTLAFYLHLRSSEKYAQRPELLTSHPIFDRLLSLKQALVTLEDLGLTPSNDDDEDDDFDTSMSLDDMLGDEGEMWSPEAGLDENELDELLKDAALSEVSTKLQEPVKKKRKTSSKSSTTTTTTPIFDLTEPDFSSLKPTSSRIQSNSSILDAYGEATSLQYADAADKSARKKSLRFHTSKIENASARRRGARNQAVGGDDDLPYRERRKERDARLSKEAADKVKIQGGEDLEPMEPEIRGEKRRRQEEDSGEEVDSPDGYYELVKKKSKEKKDKKKADYEAIQAASRPDMDQDNVTGPRSLTRSILANKGLTPHRPKSVRNPRVKKRQKFEKAKKKIASQKAVYKGGLADTGRYDGEKSGISKVVKSIRLG